MPTEIAPRRELQEFLIPHLRRVGYGPRPHKLGRGKRFAWQRPPFHTGLVLAQRPLQEHLAVPCNRSVDDLVDIYERFIGGYVRGRKFGAQKPDFFIARSLGVHLLSARQLFVPPAEGRLRLDLHLMLVQFAQLVAYNHECEVEEGEDTFAVTVAEGLQFGVRCGKLISNLRRQPRREIPVRFLRAEGGSLANIARGTPVMLDHGTAYDTVRYWLTREEAKLGMEAEPLQFALNLLWWRTAGVPLLSLQSLACAEGSDEALHEALQLARQFESFDDPLQALHDIFVPQFLSQPRFSKLFGSVYQTRAKGYSPRMKQKWLTALEELEPMTAEQ